MASLFERFLARSRSEPPQPTLPRPRLVETTRPEAIYAIGDVHGCYDQLLAMEQIVLADAEASPGDKWIVMLGDYVDRGPASAQVLDHLLAPAPGGLRRICLAGNHDQIMLDFIADPEANIGWLELGGLETLFSYGIPYAQIEGKSLSGRHFRQVLDSYIPPEHLEFLAGLPVSLSVPGLVFAHAGLRPGVPLEAQSEFDLLWIRGEFLDVAFDFGATIVHGHTIVPEPYVSPARISLDTGAFATGRLTAARIGKDGSVRLLTAQA